MKISMNKNNIVIAETNKTKKNITFIYRTNKWFEMRFEN